MEERERTRKEREKERRNRDHGHLRIKASDLETALEGHFGEGVWLLDQETGEVLFVDEDELREDPEQPYEDPRYLPITPMESWQSFGIMEDFVEGLPQGGPRQSLETALRHRKPFRTFKDRLLAFPRVREDWFRFHDDRMRELARQWIEDNLPGAELV